MPTCEKHHFVDAIEEDSIEVGGVTFTAALPARRCARCGETRVDGPALERFERAVDQTIAEKGPASGATLKHLRRSLGMRAADLAPLLDVAAETISRWETGERDVDKTAWLAVARMVLDRLEGKSATIDRLRSLGDRPTLAKAVRLEVNGGKRASR